MSKNEEKKLQKKIENFFGQTVFGFWKTMIRATYGEKMKKIVRAVLEISSLLGIGHARAGRHAWPKSTFFVWKFLNGSIREVNRLKSKFEHLLKNFPTTGSQT